MYLKDIINLYPSPLQSVMSKLFGSFPLLLHNQMSLHCISSDM